MNPENIVEYMIDSLLAPTDKVCDVDEFLLDLMVAEEKNISRMLTEWIGVNIQILHNPEPVEELLKRLDPAKMSKTAIITTIMATHRIRKNPQRIEFFRKSWEAIAEREGEESAMREMEIFVREE